MAFFKRKTRHFSIALLGAVLFNPGNVALADGQQSSGLLVGSKNDPYWFQMNGAMRFDQCAFLGSPTSRGHEVKNGANFRLLKLSIVSGLGDQTSCAMNFTHNVSASTVDVDAANITYAYDSKTLFTVGQVNAAFSIENSANANWLPFLEKSMSTTAISPAGGLGFYINKWQDNYSLCASVVQPKQKGSPKRNDHWHMSSRLSYVPFRTETQLIQVGISSHLQDDSKNPIVFKALPDITGKHVTEVLGSGPVVAKNHKTLSLDLSGQVGSICGETEYKLVHVNRALCSPVQFEGFHIQASYILTGESRVFNPSNGTFAQVKNLKNKSAYEVAARYSMVSLNSKDVEGGRAYSFTTGLNYYVNNNIRLSGEYVYSIQRSSYARMEPVIANTNLRKLNIFALRLQGTF